MSPFIDLFFLFSHLEYRVPFALQPSSMPFESLPLEDNSSYLAVLPNKAYVFSIRQNMCKEGLAMGKTMGRAKGLRWTAIVMLTFLRKCDRNNNIQCWI